MVEVQRFASAALGVARLDGCLSGVRRATPLPLPSLFSYIRRWATLPPLTTPVARLCTVQLHTHRSAHLLAAVTASPSPAPQWKRHP